MELYFHQTRETFHLTNGAISYIIKVLPNGMLANLYFGKAVADRLSFDHLLESVSRPMAPCIASGGCHFSLEHCRQEYPSYGTADFRQPAVRIRQINGSTLTEFHYMTHRVIKGKRTLVGLPATYCESEDEALTLTIELLDAPTQAVLELSYTIFRDEPALARSARITNRGTQPLHLEDALSLSLDLPDMNYDMVHFSGAWARERHMKVRKLEQGVQSIGSTRGISSHNHNPFLMLRRPHTTETEGEVLGFSLIYSGNFLAQVEVDAWETTRVSLGIHPMGFDWKLEAGQSFQTPEAVAVWTDNGMGAMSHTFHRLYRTRLARGVWRDRPRPILLNNWEATGFRFTEDSLLEIARTACSIGVELFVLDDGWFGNRRDDRKGLGDWYASAAVLPSGLPRLAERIAELGMLFGLWIEPEMVNEDSNLYRMHPDWVLETPGRRRSYGRNQLVLDFSRPEVVDTIYEQIATLLRTANIAYIKWDMNRCLTEVYSVALPADRQGEVFHRYTLGVYGLYERLTSEFPDVLFESCSSGGGRFDPGILYYAPQGWTSDDSDAAERLAIQYGTSFCYPLSAIGAHVSEVPNQQVYRTTPLHTRANVACFGTFGYELDLNRLTDKERAEAAAQVVFMKRYREVLQFGTFYRLLSPFEDDQRFVSWMVVSEDRKTAIVGWYKLLNEVNGAFHRVKLRGLHDQMVYRIENVGSFGGDELMYVGLVTSDAATGQITDGAPGSCDFDSRLFILHAE